MAVFRNASEMINFTATPVLCASKKISEEDQVDLEINDIWSTLNIRCQFYKYWLQVSPDIENKNCTKQHESIVASVYVSDG